MERTKKSKDLVHFIKTGGGSFRYTNHKGKRVIVKQNQKFWEYPENIPENFRDNIIPVDGSKLPTEAEKIPADIAKSDYQLKRRGENSPWWDVFDINGKKMNEKALKHEQALEFIKDLK